jgi:Protein of unknown function (DUF3800)
MRVVACDESGSEGERLIGGETDVFAHASVLLSVEAAAECVREVHDRIRSPVVEYKANHLLREKHRPVLEWLLAPGGPIHGNANVHLTDKAFFIVGRIVDLIGGGRDAEAMAAALHRDGPRAFGRERWEALLGSFNDLMRVRSRHGAYLPVLDPLIPAVVRAVDYWSADGHPVSIVHDEQLALTEDRIIRLKELLNGRLASLRLVDSRSDPRVQVADFLAGVARKIASNELNNRGDPSLTALLRPYVDPCSIWPRSHSC